LAREEIAMTNRADAPIVLEYGSTRSVERRPSWRVEYRDPEPIRPPRPDPVEDRSQDGEIPEDPDDLGPALGIATGVALSLLLWAAAGLAVWLI
jgi:hypothetical protein